MQPFVHPSLYHVLQVADSVTPKCDIWPTRDLTWASTYFAHFAPLLPLSSLGRVAGLMVKAIGE